MPLVDKKIQIGQIWQHKVTGKKIKIVGSLPDLNCWIYEPIAYNGTRSALLSVVIEQYYDLITVDYVNFGPEIDHVAPTLFKDFVSYLTVLESKDRELAFKQAYSAGTGLRIDVHEKYTAYFFDKDVPLGEIHEHRVVGKPSHKGARFIFYKGDIERL